MLISERRSLRARQWSNIELQRLAPIFVGSVVNVSAWKDEDKEGRHYREYFTQASEYVTTNYGGSRGLLESPAEIVLDLEQSLPDDLQGRFDLVLSHTTLEHVFDVRKAFHNLCCMSRDAVLVIVPFAQIEHWTESYGDYWRFTHQTLARLFKEEGLQLVYKSNSDEIDTAVYVLGLGVRDPARWEGQLPKSSQSNNPLANWLGRPNWVERLVLALRLGRQDRPRDR